MSDITVVNGPTIPQSELIYQVTLENGAILTRAFPDPKPSFGNGVIVAETGRILAGQVPSFADDQTRG